MYNVMEKSCFYILNTLYRQSVFCIILFILIFAVSKISKEKSPHWQLGLWFIILIRLILPTDLSLSFSARNLVNNFLPAHNLDFSLDKVSDSLAGKYQTIQTSELRSPIEMAGQDDISPPNEGGTCEDKFKTLSWSVIVSIFWLSGVLTFLFVFLHKVRSIKQVLDFSALVRDKETTAIVDNWRQCFKIKRSVAIYSSNKFLSPFTSGLFRPKIFIPEPLLKGMDKETLNSIIAHEMVHIKHFDHAWVRLQNILQAIYFFNPIVWYVNSRINIERDRLCDSKVLSKHVIPPKAFGKSVIDVLKFNLSGHWVVKPMLCFSSHKNVYEYRLKNILKEKNISKPKSMLIFLFVCLLGLFLLPMSKANIDVEKPEVSKKSQADAEHERVVAEAHFDAATISELSEEQTEIPSQAKRIEVPPPPTVSEKSGKSEDLLGLSANVRNLDASGETIQKADRPEAESIQDFSAKIPRKEAPVKSALYKEEVNPSGRKEQTIEKAEPDPHIKTSAPLNQEKKPKIDYFTRGLSNLEKDKNKDAISDFSMAIDLDPGKAISYVARGSAYFKLDKLKNALSDYNKAIEIDPAFAAAFQNRGSVYYRQGQFDKAVSDYNRSIEINPELTASYQDRGSIYQSRGRFDEAISDYSKALELNSEDYVTYNNRGVAYFSRKQYKKAFADLNKAIDTNPKYTTAYIYRGYFYQMTGDLKKAAADYTQAHKLSPENPVAGRLLREAVGRFAKSKLENYITDKDQKLVCRWIKMGGSHIMREKECRTREG